MGKTNKQSGEINSLLVPLILVIIVALGLSGFGAWSYFNYTDARDNVQSKVEVAVAEAQKVQKEEDTKEFAEREKEPYRQFVGPAELGRVEFSYPKTWSVYIDENGEGGNFNAIFHPIIVHSLDENRPYALRVVVEPRSYESQISSYQGEVENGDLRSDAVTVNGFNGVRLSGNFSRDVPNGTMVLFKIRDKTLSISSEAPEFFSDFNNIVLETLRFNP